MTNYAEKITLNVGDPVVDAALFDRLRYRTQWEPRLGEYLNKVRDCRPTSTDCFSKQQTFYTHYDAPIKTLLDTPMHHNKVFIIERDGASKDRADVKLYHGTLHQGIIEKELETASTKAKSEINTHYERKIAQLKADLLKAEQDQQQALFDVDECCDKIVAHLQQP